LIKVLQKGIKGIKKYEGYKACDMKPRILFMGTPAFAIPSLKILLEHEYPVLGVVTQPDRPRGRGRKLVALPVKDYATTLNIPIYQPERVRDEKFLETFREISPAMVVLVAFGQILPREIIEFPPLGCVNVHPSMLPKYRGPAPMNWAIIRGEEKTGVTIMRIDEGMDSGDIFLQEETALGAAETFDQLHNRLSEMGAQLLLKAVEGISAGIITRTPQDSSLVTMAPKITRETGRIDWKAPAREIVNLIRGLSSTPGAYAFFKGKKLKIFAAAGEEIPTTGVPGELSALKKKGKLRVTAGDGYVFMEELQIEGKKRMKAGDFLRGYSISPGDLLE